MKNKYYAFSFLMCLFYATASQSQGTSNYTYGTPLMEPEQIRSYGPSRITSSMARSTGDDGTPSTPEVASFQNNMQMHVGEDIGMISVSLPLCNFEYRNLSVPISMRYRSSGFMPGVEPGNMGYNWELQAGGKITRIINGEIDIESPGYSSREGITNPVVTGNNWTNLDEVDSAPSHMPSLYTSEPDKYMFNINGRSGSFYLQTTSGTFRIQSSEGEYFRVEVRQKQFAGKYIVRGFTLADTYGVKYYFGEMGEETNNYIDHVKYYGIKDMFDPNRQEPLESAWHLNRIIHPQGNSLLFTYKKDSILIADRFRQGKNDLLHL